MRPFDRKRIFLTEATQMQVKRRHLEDGLLLLLCKQRLHDLHNYMRVYCGIFQSIELK